MTSKEFEEKVGWINTLLEGSGAKVRVDEKIPDPDNPKQKRQIDVKITRGEHITLIECRIHSKRQNVKWIEELYGRRISLKASSVIAVSASGFTEGAKKKADRLGVFLRDFKTLSEDEIKNWGIASSVYLEYVTFFDTTFFIIIEPQTIGRKVLDQPYFETPANKSWPIDTVFHKALAEIKKLDQKKGGIRFELFTKELLYRGSQINEIIFQSNYKTIRFPIELPLVYVYGEPISSIKSEMYIESQNSSKFEIYRTQKQVFVTVDISVAKAIDGSMFKSILFDFKVPVSMQGIKFIGEDKNSIYAIPFEVSEIQRDSKMHINLKSTFA